MADTCVRRIRILQMLKNKADGYITIPEIMSGLSHYGIDDVKKRTVERDMQDLSLDFSIVCDSSTRPYRWWWDGNENIEIPAMGRNTALTFKLAQEYLEPLMPATSFNFLKPKFRQANRILTTKDKAKEKEWIKKIRVISHEVKSFPVVEPNDVHISVYDALYDNKMLTIKYSPPNKKASTRLIHPLALIYQ
ncbi:MAG: hypothetical protein HQL46_15855 [Gammaproteobacteria bacterium]|nr:hypothetical protein [Gammaproteobacteria bacterium]